MELVAGDLVIGHLNLGHGALARAHASPFVVASPRARNVLEASDARVATMSSGVANAGRIRFDDLQYERRRYIPMLAYGQSKLADLLLTRHLAVLAADRGWSLRSTSSWLSAMRAFGS